MTRVSSLVVHFLVRDFFSCKHFEKLLLFWISWLFLILFFFPFLCVDYSVYVIKIALFRISLFLSHIWTRRLKSVSCFWVWIKCFSKKKKKKERYAARGRHFSPSLPGDSNQKFGSKSGHRAQISRNFVRYDALVMKSFCLLIRIAFAKASSKMKRLRMTEYKVDLHIAYNERKTTLVMTWSIYFSKNETNSKEKATWSWTLSDLFFFCIDYQKSVQCKQP